MDNDEKKPSLADNMKLEVITTPDTRCDAVVDFKSVAFRCQEEKGHLGRHRFVGSDNFGAKVAMIWTEPGDPS